MPGRIHLRPLSMLAIQSGSITVGGVYGIVLGSIGYWRSNKAPPKFFLSQSEADGGRDAMFF